MRYWSSGSAQSLFTWTRKQTHQLLSMAREHNPLSARHQELLRSCVRDLKELKDSGQRRREEVMRMLKVEVKQRLEQRRSRAAVKRAARAAAAAPGCACRGQCRELCRCYVRGLLEVSTYIGIVAAILLTVKLLKE